MKTYILTALLFATVHVFAQKVSDDDLNFEYKRLPADPACKGVTNYTSKVVLSYEAENAAKMEEYNKQMAGADQQYEQDVKDYPEKVKQAEEKYKKEMEEWDKKSMGTKIAEKTMLGINDKPQKQIPQKPYKSYPSKPAMKKAYDKDMLASTYLSLDGFTKNSSNAVVVTATLMGFEAIEPQLKNETRNAYSNGATHPVNYCWYETSYKHPMSVKVEVPGKGEVLNQGIEQFNQYVVAKTTATEGSGQQMNREAYTQQLEDKCIAENMKYINQMVNEKYGYSKIKRGSVLYNIKPKGDNKYDDYQTAYESAMAGYNMIGSDPAAGKAKLKASIDIWEKALLEYKSGGDKHARVNDDVALSTRFNLAEAYMWTDEYAKADEQLIKTTSLDPSRRQRKWSEEFKTLMGEQKKRFEANK